MKTQNINIYDYIIVGGGIAGSILALKLVDLNLKVLIVNKDLAGSSSKVAAGVVNPVTGKRLVKSWIIDELNQSSDVFYKQIEQLSEQTFFHKKDIVRVFKNYQEQNDFISKSSEAAYEHYLKENDDEIVLQYLENDFGSGTICQSACLDAGLFLDAAKKILQKKASLIEDEFNFDELEINDPIVWKNISSKSIIFCEGYRMKDNPLFNYLPLAPLKGEFLLIRADELPRTNMIKKGVIIVPYKENLFWVGSTYDREELSLKNTVNGVEGLKTKLASVLNTLYTVQETGFGIRPTVVDRRPLIGEHPQHKNVFVFNGLGSKGVSLAPFFTQHFVDYLEHGGKLMKEVDIKRHKKYLY